MRERGPRAAPRWRLAGLLPLHLRGGRFRLLHRLVGKVLNVLDRESVAEPAFAVSRFPFGLFRPRRDLNQVAGFEFFARPFDARFLPGKDRMFDPLGVVDPLAVAVLVGVVRANGNDDVGADFLEPTDAADLNVRVELRNFLSPIVGPRPVAMAVCKRRERRRQSRKALRPQRASEALRAGHDGEFWRARSARSRGIAA